ncbi:hypothetical protein F6P93_21965 [Escherichia coli]|nr:hypothetical protein F6P93_21965 [Escherichia coli]
MLPFTLRDVSYSITVGGGRYRQESGVSFLYGGGEVDSCDPAWQPGFSAIWIANHAILPVY